MDCSVCKRPLLAGTTTCIVCGAKSEAPAGAASSNAPQMPIFDAYAAEPLPPQMQPQTPPASQTAYGPTQAYAPAPPPQPPPQWGPMMTPTMASPAPPFSSNAPNAPHMLANVRNDVAIASLICGMCGLIPFWIGFVLCVAAIVCGIMGINASARLPNSRGRNFAIAGLVLGLLFLVPAGCGL